MQTAAQMREKVTELRANLIDEVTHFVQANPGMPAQAIMAGLGELLIQFSVGQVGPQMTDKFLDELKEAVRHFIP